MTNYVICPGCGGVTVLKDPPLVEEAINSIKFFCWTEANKNSDPNTPVPVYSIERTVGKKAVLWT